jgi:hypothetical protein
MFEERGFGGIQREMSLIGSSCPSEVEMLPDRFLNGLPGKTIERAGRRRLVYVNYIRTLSTIYTSDR